MKSAKGEVVFVDETGAEQFRGKDAEAIALFLRDEVFCDGYERGKAETVDQIVAHARLL